MDKKQLFIPSKIKVGFQERKGTYTGKLAFVIYYDLTGKLRKETSWEGWRDSKISPVEFDNVPTEGFVLNKGVGGQRQSYGWNARNEYIRVYDPRDFEFEISVANLLFILRECDCSRGKGLEGKFVYAWDGTELVLLPAISEDYQNSQKFTTLQGQGVKVKEMIQGASYVTKRQEVLTYLGRFDHHEIASEEYIGGRYVGNQQRPRKHKAPLTKKFVFWDGKRFIFMDNLKKVAVMNSDTVTPDLADLTAMYYKSVNGSKPVRVFLKDAPKRRKKDRHDEMWVYEESPGVFIECQTNLEWDTDKISLVSTRHRVYLKDDALFTDDYYVNLYPPGSRNRRCGGYSNEEVGKWVEPTGKLLWVELESGSQFQYAHERLIDPKKKEDEDGEKDYD